MSGVASAAAQFCALEAGSVLSSASVFASVGWGTGHGPGGRAPRRGHPWLAQSATGLGGQWPASGATALSPTLPFASVVPWTVFPEHVSAFGTLLSVSPCGRPVSVASSPETYRGRMRRALACVRSGLDEAEEQPVVARIVGLWHV